MALFFRSVLQSRQYPLVDFAPLLEAFYKRSSNYSASASYGFAKPIPLIDIAR